MKKIFALAAILTASVFYSYSDTGFGFEAGFAAELSAFAFASASVRFDESPWSFSVNFSPLKQGGFFCADNRFVYAPLSSTVNRYVFWGISAGAYFDDFELNTGARLGFGIECFLTKQRAIELYIQGAWNPYIGIKNDGDDADDTEFFLTALSFPVSLGARLWIR